MTGVVFIVTFPSNHHENDLKSKCSKKKVVIVDPKTHNSPTCTPLSAREKSSEGRDEDVFNKFTPNMSPIRSDYEYVSMEKLIKDILLLYKLECSACYQQIDTNYTQVIFTVEEGDKCEEILEFLREHNVGIQYDSTISIIPCSLYYQGTNNDDCDGDGASYLTNNVQTDKVRDTAWTRFVTSVRARLTVAQVVEVLKADAALTFDFICLLVIAALLCAIGLVEDSNVYLLSSMLISPMMGPVMAGTFGTVINDRMLQKLGTQTELIGLGVTTLVGFCYGAIICLCTDKYGEVDWPTSEMVSRGEVRNLGVGCLVALLSGAAVAVGVLSDNIASLVGVAISTSLMPPAVNAGLLWSLATVYYIKGNDTTRYATLTTSDHYSSSTFLELMSLGGISICLTFVNIICIYVAGILMFKIKEVAPIKMKNETRRQFWKHDIRITRDYNKTLQKEEAKLMQSQLENEMKHQRKLTQECYNSGDDKNDSSKGSMPSWSPCKIMSKRPTIQELEDLYKNITRETNSPSVASNFSFGSSRKLAQVIDREFNASPQLIPEIVVASTMNQSTCSKKFTVTPCTLDM